MKISFACPECGARGSADEAYIGRQVRCKPCQHRFVIPGGADDDGGYRLDQPVGPIDDEASSPVFVSARGDEPSVSVSPRRPRATRSDSQSRKSRREGPDFAWGTWLLRIGIVAALIIGGIALFAPRGVVIAGLTLALLGTAMVMIGWCAGAYGAFSEDFLYGFLYFVFPFYTAYYLVTRWEDLWKWWICSTVGVGLVTLGTAMLRWAGVAE